uniref:Heat shock protein 70 n=1 Tax=Ditylenchus dipsaci TaxID=166011 RepID=A0A915CUR2_9BILA
MSDIVVGIDLGTTILAQFRRLPCHPSCVSYTDDGVLVGNPATRKLVSNAENTVYDMKRLIGKKIFDENVQKHMKYWPFKVTSDELSHPLVEVNSDSMCLLQRPVDISAKVLKKMVETAELSTQSVINKAVITVPAYFNQSQKAETIEAAKLAGLEVLELITEPSAAAYAYGYDSGKFDNYKILVFDFGGGTFDVSIIEVKEGQFRVMAIGGDTNLGGRDIDNHLLDYCIDEIETTYGRKISGNKKLRQKLLTKCEALKVALSSTKEESIFLGDLFADLDEELLVDRVTLDDECEELFEKAISLTQQTIDDAGLSADDINEVLLVGGTSRIPKLQEMLAEMFMDKSLNNTINLDEAVAYGAAIRATQLQPLCRSSEHLWRSLPPIIAKNSNIPNQQSTSLYTSVNDQNAMRFQIYEGERRLIKDNNFLGEFTLLDLPKGIVGSVKAELILNIDKNGIMHVSASNGERISKLTINYNLKKSNDVNVEEMIKEAKLFEEQDSAEYERLRAKSDLQVEIEKAQYNLEKHNTSATQSYIAALCKNMTDWVKSNETASKQAFKTQLTQFKSSLRQFA